MTVQVNGQLIKALRIKHSYSQEELAEIVGINLRTIQRVETNGVAALSTRRALANALGVEPADLDARDAPMAAAPLGEPVGASALDVTPEKPTLPLVPDAAPPDKSLGHRTSWSLVALATVLLVFASGIVLAIILDNKKEIEYFTADPVAAPPQRLQPGEPQ